MFIWRNISINIDRSDAGGRRAQILEMTTKVFVVLATLLVASLTTPVEVSPTEDAKILHKHLSSPLGNIIPADDTYMHPWFGSMSTGIDRAIDEETDPNFWINQAQATLLEKSKQPLNKSKF